MTHFAWGKFKNSWWSHGLIKQCETFGFSGGQLAVSYYKSQYNYLTALTTHFSYFYSTCIVVMNRTLSTWSHYTQYIRIIGTGWCFAEVTAASNFTETFWTWWIFWFKSIVKGFYIMHKLTAHFNAFLKRFEVIISLQPPYINCSQWEVSALKNHRISLPLQGPWLTGNLHVSN